MTGQVPQAAVADTGEKGLPACGRPLFDKTHWRAEE